MKLRRRKCIIPSCASHHRVDENEPYCCANTQEEESAWSHNSAHVTSHLAQCFPHAMVGPRAWIGGFFSRSSNKKFGSDKYLNYTLTPIQEERLQRLQERLRVPFDELRTDHQEALKALWDAAFPNIKLRGLISEQWKDMGWQGANPSTDFRGCGFLSLENLLFFARNYPATFHRLLLKQGGERAKWEYPFAVAGINITFMLIQMLDLHSEKPRCLPGLNFIKLLEEDEDAFDNLYCIAFAMVDAQWLAMHASYMEFNEVLQVTRTQLEREMSLEDINRIHDLPAYNMLHQQ
ncbi:ELMO/CED-12 family protein [Striga hermonthica]|uniref:ELMO/CED-12 family protein n=1 Tax=Striga hermonthica TaxID=68872 RepID=A0A9N7MNE0_STRHE|nr:ELMO/CED-12 family protein [Striga hermonthica]